MNDIKETDENLEHCSLEEIHKLLEWEGTVATYQEQLDLVKVFHEFQDLFPKDDSRIKPSKVVAGTIPFKPDAKPTYIPAREIPRAYKQKVQEKLQVWLESGVISKCQSQYNSPIHCVKKGDAGDIRVVLDYRQLNANIQEDPTIPIKVDSIIKQIPRYRYCSTLDAPQAYLQIGIVECDRSKTAFFGPDRQQYMFNVMPFGLKTSGSCFIRCTNQIMMGLPENIQFYVDDILITSETFEDHLLHIRALFKRIRALDLKLSYRKSKICREKVRFLGIQLSADGK